MIKRSISEVPTILLLIRYYLPGYKSGGQMRTVVNMVKQLGSEFHFKIITLDRDKHDPCPYKDTQLNTWVRMGNACVFYIQRKPWSFLRIIKLMRETPHDLIYLNSFFDSLFALCPLLARYLHLIPRSPFVVAVRGELSPGALKFKYTKKSIYIKFLQKFRVFSSIIWQASSEYEATDIRSVLGATISVQIAPDLPSMIIASPSQFDALNKRQDSIRIVFLSRIDRKKNLKFALDVLANVEVPVTFNIFGAVDDQEYWAECLACIKRLPPHIEVNYRGAIAHESVAYEIAKHDLFFLPTHSENYGHVIFEALASGVPVLISDKTPWRGLQAQGVGYDVTLDDRARFAQIIKTYAFMSQPEKTMIRARARNYAKSVMESSDVIEANRNLFIKAMNKSIDSTVHSR